MTNFAPPDDWFPPFLHDISDEEERERIHQQILQDIKRRNEQRRARKRGMKDAAQASSDSEVDELTKAVKKVEVTPGSTPQELVKLDP